MATLLETLETRVAKLIAPLAGTPAGTDMSFDPQFERVKGEVEKLAALAGETPNWVVIEETCSALLRDKTKDLRVAAWFTLAAAQRRGWEGFVEGALVLRGLARSLWDSMYPDAKRARARANLFGWLAEQVGPVLEKRGVRAQDVEAVGAASTLLGELDALLAEKLGPTAAGLGPALSVVRAATRAAAEAAPPPAPAAAAPAPPAMQDATPAGAAGPASAPSAGLPPPLPPPRPPPLPSGGGAAMPAIAAPAVSPGDDPIAVVRACGHTLVEVARALRRTDPTQAWPYRLHRLGIWLPVRGAPPAEGRRTRIPAPAEDVRRRLESLRSQERWLDVLNAAEDAAAGALFWLDAHRIAAVALDRLGPTFAGAREAVGRETAAFVKRMPDIASLTFADESPFADAATQAFLEAEAKRWEGGGGGAGPARAVTEEDEALAKRFEEAQGLVTAGKAVEGLALAQELAQRGADARTRYRARLRVAELALEGGKADVARPILAALAEEGARHGLDVWEPALLAQVYVAFLKAEKGAATKGKEGDTLALFASLCRLDPAAALRFGGA